MARCYIALGGNAGPVESTFDQALDRLAATPGVAVGPVSCIHRTRPVGEKAGAMFLNAAAEIITDRPPLELLDLLQSVEAQFGRRRALRWGPRILDLDLILYEDRVLDLPRLRVPHPACWYRRFVLDPLVEIAADAVHPEKRIPIRDLRARLLVRPLSLFVAGGDPEQRSDVIDSLHPSFPKVEFGQWEPAFRFRPAGSEPLHDTSKGPLAGDVEPTFVAWLGYGKNSHHEYDDLTAIPRTPRLDASAAEDPAAFLKHVLQSALG